MPPLLKTTCCGPQKDANAKLLDHHFQQCDSGITAWALLCFRVKTATFCTGCVTPPSAKCPAIRLDPGVTQAGSRSPDVHLARVDLHDARSGLFGRDRKLDLSVESARPQQRRVQDVDAVRRCDHLATETPSRDSLASLAFPPRQFLNESQWSMRRLTEDVEVKLAMCVCVCVCVCVCRTHLDFGVGLEAVELVEQLEHGSLHLSISRLLTVEPLRA